MADVEAAKVHTVFSAECNPTFDWHSIALFHSHKTSGQPGGITRLLACNEDELATYHGLSIGQPQARVRARARVRVRVRGDPNRARVGGNPNRVTVGGSPNRVRV